MKKLFVLFAILTVINMGVIQEVSAELTNPGFETGDTTGWTVVLFGGSAKIVTFHNGSESTYYPMEGNNFLKLKPEDPDIYVTASQTVILNAGNTLSGWAAFDSRDYMPFNDDAAVQIYDASGKLLATPWGSDVRKLGKYSDDPWTLWRWTAPADGEYTLVYCVANARDGTFDSYALFDTEVASELPPEVPDGREVSIDIKPGSYPNSINLKSKGEIPVAILSTKDFDATTVDGETVRFGPGEAEPDHGSGHLEDVNGDSLVDWLGHFRTQETGLSAGDTEAYIKGKTQDGDDLFGTDSVNIVP